MKKNNELKEKIRHFSEKAGADLIGFAPAERWDEANEVPPEFRPQAIWKHACTVIVLGVAMPLPIVETTPSFLHKEMYTAANQTLDGLAFNLVRYLNRLGHSAFFLTRDGFCSLQVLRERPQVIFSHVMAAKYAGLGTIGVNNCLLTPEFGPRVRFVSVFTSAYIPPDPMIEKDLCIKCGACEKCCPVNAITQREDRVRGDYNYTACLEKHIELGRYKNYPCGICTKVCPIGKDRDLYQQKDINIYLREKEALAADPDDPAYRAWTHVRKYGSWNAQYPPARKKEDNFGHK